MATIIQYIIAAAIIVLAIAGLMRSLKRDNDQPDCKDCPLRQDCKLKKQKKSRAKA